MAMLKLNGITIPTLAAGPGIDTKDIGESIGGAFDGTLISSVRARKRTYKFTTPPVSASYAKWLRGWVRGDGYYMSYDGIARTSSGRSSSSSVTALMSTTAADGASAVDNLANTASPVAYSKFGSGSVQIDQGVTNILSAAQSQGTGGWSIGGTATFSDTTHFWESTSAFKALINGGANCFPTTPTISYAIGDAIYASVYLYTAATLTGNVTITLSGGAITLATITIVPANLPAGVWTRFGINSVATGSGTAVNFIISPVNTSTIWIDGAQIEKHLAASLDHGHSAWVVGGGTRAQGFIQYAMNPASALGFTFNAWVTNPGSLVTAAANGQLFAITGQAGGSNNTLQCFYSAGRLAFQSLGPTGGAAFVNPLLTLSSTAYSMVTCVLDLSNTTLYLYVNGALVASGSTAGSLVAIPFNGALAGLTLANVGSAYSALTWGGRIDEVQMLPYPVDQNWVTQMFAQTAAVSGPPLLLATGDSIDEDPVGLVVKGEVMSERYVGFRDPTTGWKANNRQLDIVLREV